MEGDLDKVADGNEDWVALLARFYGPFESELEAAEKKLPRLELRDEPTDEICPNCGRPMVIKTGRFGKFISCTRLSRVQDDEADRQRHRRELPERRRHDRRAPVEEGAHVLRLRQLSEVRLRLVGRVVARALPGLRFARRREDAARRRGAAASAPPTGPTTSRRLREPAGKSPTELEPVEA